VALLYPPGLIWARQTAAADVIQTSHRRSAPPNANKSVSIPAAVKKKRCNWTHQAPMMPMTRTSLIRLKRAPTPISGNAANITPHLGGEDPSTSRISSSCSPNIHIHDRAARARVIAQGRATAGGGTRSTASPLGEETRIVIPAIVASSRRNALKVEVSILIEGDGVGAVFRTKHIATSVQTRAH
jgi:hypothetical protein